MSDLVTVFEITPGSNGVRADALFRGAIGVIALITGVWGLFSGRRERFFKRLLPSAFAIVWSVLWLSSVVPLWRIAFVDMSELLSVYESGKAEVAEGVIHVLHQQPATGHSSGDKVTIGDKTFEINYYVVTPGYKQTIAHGGALRDGVFARVHHHDGVILKVEVMKSAAGQPKGS